MKILRFLIILLFLIFPLGQLTKIPIPVFFSPEVNIYLQDLIIAILVIFFLFYLFIKKGKFPYPPLAKPIFLFFIIAFFSLSLNSYKLKNIELLISSFYLLRWAGFAFIYFIVFFLTRKKLLYYKNILKWLSGIGITTALLGLFQYFFYPNLRNLSYLSWDPHYLRVFGSFLDSGYIGIILVLTLIILTVLIFSKDKDIKVFFKIGWILTYVILSLTYSRSSYLAFLFSMGVFSYFAKLKKFLAFIIIIFSITLIFLPKNPQSTIKSEGMKLKRTSTIKARLYNYKQTLTIFRKNILFGAGFNTLRYVKRDYDFLDKNNWQKSHSGAGSDSSFLFVLATTGIFGFFAYLWIFIKALMVEQFNKKTMQLVIPIITALIIHSVFLNSLFYPWVMLLLWSVLGVAHGSFNNRLVSS